MENEKGIFAENSIGLWSDIRQALPIAAEMLSNEDHTYTVDDLKVISPLAFSHVYLYTQFRDQPLDTCGLVEGTPLLQNHRLHAKQSVGLGLILFRSQSDHSLQYVKFVNKESFSEVHYFIIPKGKVGQFVRIAKNYARRLASDNKAPVLADGLLDNLVKNTIGFLKHAKEIEEYGVRIKRGLILDGPPGNGKTMACRYIQKLCVQNNIDWGTVTSSDIDKAYQDRNLNALFGLHVVTFFDDIDISYLNRSSGNGKMACSLLTAMDGMDNSGHVVRIFTTNERVSSLDKAFVRPGRIDIALTFDAPNQNLRRQLIELWPEEIRNNIDTKYLANFSVDWSFADLEAIRTLLVTNFLLDEEHTWDLERALKDFNNRKEDSKTMPLGFTPQDKPIRRAAAQEKPSAAGFAN